MKKSLEALDSETEPDDKSALSPHASFSDSGDEESADIDNYALLNRHYLVSSSLSDLDNGRENPYYDYVNNVQRWLSFPFAGHSKFEVKDGNRHDVLKYKRDLLLDSSLEEDDSLNDEDDEEKNEKYLSKIDDNGLKDDHDYEEVNVEDDEEKNEKYLSEIDDNNLNDEDDEEVNVEDDSEKTRNYMSEIDDELDVDRHSLDKQHHDEIIGSLAFFILVFASYIIWRYRSYRRMKRFGSEGIGGRTYEYQALAAEYDDLLGGAFTDDHTYTDTLSDGESIGTIISNWSDGEGVSKIEMKTKNPQTMMI